MNPGAELQWLSPGLAVWAAPDSSTGADLFATVVRLGDGLFLIDPVALAEPALRELTASARICSVLLTNRHHLRAAESFAARFGAAILASAETASALNHIETLAVFPGDRIGDGIEVVPIEGAIAGELAFYLQVDDGSVVFGDAVRPGDSQNPQLALRPEEGEPQRLRDSLRQLFDFSFHRLLFAHGPPLQDHARAQLAALVADR